MKRHRSDAALFATFAQHYNGEQRDLDAALRAVYALGVEDERGPVRKSPRRSAVIEETAKRVFPFIRRIAKARKFDYGRLMSGRDHIAARERHTVMLVLRSLPGRRMSYPVIGAAFGKDHSTVMVACRKVERRIANDPGLGAQLRNLARRVGAVA